MTFKVPRHVGHWSNKLWKRKVVFPFGHILCERFGIFLKLLAMSHCISVPSIFPPLPYDLFLERILKVILEGTFNKVSASWMNTILCPSPDQFSCAIRWVVWLFLLWNWHEHFPPTFNAFFSTSSSILADVTLSWQFVEVHSRWKK